ncbi:hypothetical protein [Streptodolium elevatio]|uniref:Uncharacterized protein n=1 Tax=Streptodolium elevatio TaxID=3157996 RepID=A0ABV3DJY0_9ACTN
MGYIKHDAVIVTTAEWRDGGLPDIDAFRRSLPEGFRPLVVGPIKAPLNGYVSYAFLPDGSKEYWEDSDLGDVFRAQFVGQFTALSDNVVAVSFGGDYRTEFEKPAAWYPDDDLPAVES